MARWEVLEDKIKLGKRFVRIKDTQLKKSYQNFFPLATNDNAVIARFRDHVRESRAEIARSNTTLNLGTFEAGL